MAVTSQNQPTAAKDLLLKRCSSCWDTQPALQACTLVPQPRLLPSRYHLWTYLQLVLWRGYPSLTLPAFACSRNWDSAWRRRSKCLVRWRCVGSRETQLTPLLRQVAPNHLAHLLVFSPNSYRISYKAVFWRHTELCLSIDEYSGTLFLLQRYKQHIYY